MPHSYNDAGTAVQALRPSRSQMYYFITRSTPQLLPSCRLYSTLALLRDAWHQGLCATSERMRVRCMATQPWIRSQCHHVARSKQIQLQPQLHLLQQLLLLLAMLPSWLVPAAEGAIVNGVGATPAMGWNSWNTFRYVGWNSCTSAYTLFGAPVPPNSQSHFYNVSELRCEVCFGPGACLAALCLSEFAAWMCKLMQV
jgi:hypothetical protein